MDRARFSLFVISININFIFTIVIVTIIIIITIITVTLTNNNDRRQFELRNKQISRDETTTDTTSNVIQSREQAGFSSFSSFPQNQPVRLERQDKANNINRLSTNSVVIPDPNNMIAKLAETSTNSSISSRTSNNKDAAKFETAHSISTILSSTSTSKDSSQSKRKRAKLLDQLLNTNWSKQSQQASNLLKLNKLLLVCNANFLDEKSGESPLSLAISSAQINNASHQTLFTSLSSSSSSTSNSSGPQNLQCQLPVQGLGRLELTSLQQASLAELIQSKAPLIQRILLMLIKSGALIDFRNSDGRTPLHVAAMKSNFWALKTLLDLGATTDLRDINGLTPLYYSILHKADLRITQLLLNHNRNSSSFSSGSLKNQTLGRFQNHPACTGTTDDHGWQEVHHACKLGLDAHLEALIYSDCDIDAKISGSGNTPLHVAAINDQLNCVKVLLMRGANRTITNNSHQTAHQVAVVAGNMDLAEFIARHQDSMMVPFRNNDEKFRGNDRSLAERPFAKFSQSRSSANIRIQSQKSLNPSEIQIQQNHLIPLSLDVNAPSTTNTTSMINGNTTTASNQSLLSIGSNRNPGQSNFFNNNISPCLSQRSCATSNTTTSSGVCCDGDGNQSIEEQSNSKDNQLSNSQSQHSNITIISIRNGSVDSTITKKSTQIESHDDNDLGTSSDDGNSNESSSSCNEDLYSLISENRPLLTGTILEAISEYQSGDPNHLQLHRGDLIEMLDCAPELLNAGQLPLLANKPMIFGKRLSDDLTGLFPSFCVRRAKRKHKSALKNVINYEQPNHSNSQWQNRSNENNRPLSESQSMASLDRRTERLLENSREDLFKSLFTEIKVTLTKNDRGFGFVLRGAKVEPNMTSLNNEPIDSNQSNSHTSKPIIDQYIMSANNLVSLQYLDEIEPLSVAHKAGLKRGDFLIAVNGIDVRRSSHEHVVHMIRQSGNQVQLTIASPFPHGDQISLYSLNTSRTLTRSKPEPPKRDPTTTLTRNRAQRVKSMIVQPQKHIRNPFDADKPLPHAPQTTSPLSPSGSLNIDRSLSAQVAPFNSLHSLSSSSVIDSQSISSASITSVEQQHQTNESTLQKDAQQLTPSHSSSSTATLTTIAGKPKAPPKTHISPNSQQSIYQPAVITTTKRSSPPDSCGQIQPKMPMSQNPVSEFNPPPPPPMPNFSNVASQQVSTNRLIQRRTSAPTTQSPNEVINSDRLFKKRESLAAVIHNQPNGDITVPAEFGAVAAACAAAANNRLQRQKRERQQDAPEDVDKNDNQPSEAEDKSILVKNDTFDLVNKSSSINSGPSEEIVATEMIPQEKNRQDGISAAITDSKSLNQNRHAATASLGRKSSAQIIQHPKQAPLNSQTLGHRDKQRLTNVDRNELPPPPPPLPASSESDYLYSTLEPSNDISSHNNNYQMYNVKTEQHELNCRQQAHPCMSRDDIGLTMNNKNELARRQQQELIRQQLRHQHLLQHQQQLEMQKQIHLQLHQKCCIDANSTHVRHHGNTRHNNHNARIHHNHQHPERDLGRYVEQNLVQHQQQPVTSAKSSAHHHHHHHHRSHHDHGHHQSQHNYGDAPTMQANLQQQMYHHHQQAQNHHHLSHDIYHGQTQHSQASMPIRNQQSISQRASQQQQQQQYYQQIQQQQIFADGYIPSVYASDSYASMNNRGN